MELRSVLEYVYAPDSGEELGIVQLLNRAENSEDPYLRALGHRLMLESQRSVSGIEHAMRRVQTRGVTPTHVASAKFLGDHLEISSPETLELQKYCDEVGFPDCWSAAVALNEIGDPACLMTWLDRAKRSLEAGEVEQSVRALRACYVYPAVEAEDFAICAALHSSSSLRAKSAPILFEINTLRGNEVLDRLAEDPELDVRVATQRARSGTDY